jgi:hypothetical protein
MWILQIMDKRMDTGILLPNEQELPTVERALCSSDLEWEQFSSEELIEIVDTLLAAVMTWLQGHSATDTILTCVYIHDWKRVKHVYLRACVVSIGSICCEIHKKIVEDISAFESTNHI